MTVLQTLTGVTVLGYANQLVEIEVVALGGGRAGESGV